MRLKRFLYVLDFGGEFEMQPILYHQVVYYNFSDGSSIFEPSNSQSNKIVECLDAQKLRVYRKTHGK